MALFQQRLREELAALKMLGNPPLTLVWWVCPRLIDIPQDPVLPQRFLREAVASAEDNVSQAAVSSSQGPYEGVRQQADKAVPETGRVGDAGLSNVCQPYKIFALEWRPSFGRPSFGRPSFTRLADTLAGTCAQELTRCGQRVSWGHWNKLHKR
eukprot:scaffold6033_cov124-Pinguiococcus_pyrenoidosus.AAC.3